MQAEQSFLQGKRALTEIEVEAIYGLKRRSLQQWRFLGRGPRYVKAGRCVRYRVRDIEDFLDQGQVLPREERA